MNVDLSNVRVSATKPAGRVAKALAETGIQIAPILEDEGNVDRYVLSKRLAVERRTGGGFLAGIMDKTLFTSAVYLREHFRLPILIVEGKVNYEYTMFDPQATRGALTSMMLLYGINVLSTSDVAETAALIGMMAWQEQIGIPEISLIPKRKAADLPDLQRRLVEMLPGCGMVMARQMLQVFGSIPRIVAATEEELCTLHGMGVKKARGVRQVLAAEYEAVDTEKDLEDSLEAVPELLFRRRPVELLARQHHIYTDEKERHIVDMVFRDEKTDEIILVELKRGRIGREHEAQIRRYLDHARESKLLRGPLEAGAALRGVLASVAPGDYQSGADDVTVRTVNVKQTIEVLAELRRIRLGEMGGK